MIAAPAHAPSTPAAPRRARTGLRLGRCMVWLLLAGLAAMWVTPAGAQTAQRPRIGLVLGGGGARGLAHIGVLEALQELRIPVDCVAGASMGALVAGAWAAGREPAELRQMVTQTDWNDLFQDNPAYAEVDHRNKRLARRYLPGVEWGITPQGAVSPPGLVAGQKIKLFINQLVQAHTGERRIEDVPLPLSIIATDIGSGERVVFRQGDLSLAMRASMAVPGLMAPLEDQGRKLVDGGLVDNLPVQEVRTRCGADVVIAVNVGSPLLKPSEISGLLSVSAQMVLILTEQNVAQSRAQLTPADVYLQPDLGDLSAADFQRGREAADRGRAAVLSAAAASPASALAAWSLSPADYADWRARMRPSRPATLQVDAIEIAGLHTVHPAAVARHIEQQPGQPLDLPRLNRDLLRVYGDGDFEHVDYALTRQGGRNLLRILPLEKAWGPDYLRLGVHLESSALGSSAYSLRGAYQKTWLNARGAELLLSTELGAHTGLDLTLFQPLDASQTVFLEAAAGWQRERFGLFLGDARLSDYRKDRSRLDLLAGVNLGRAGQFGLGWREERQRLDLATGLPLLPQEPLDVRGALLSLELDQRKQLLVADGGWSVQAQWFASARRDYSRASLAWDGASRWQDWVLGARLSWDGATDGELPLQDSARLGGFMNLSGFARDQLAGDQAAYAQVRAERILGRMPLGLRGDLRLGMALEAGRIRQPLSEPRLNGPLNSALMYLRGETPLGMAYIGLGRAGSGQVNAYLFLGTP